MEDSEKGVPEGYRNILSQEEIEALLAEDAGSSEAESGEGELLTQEELDVLLQAVEKGDATTPPVQEEEVRPYDITSPDLGIQGFIFTLEMISERFTRLFHSSLFNILKGYADIELKDLKILTFGKYAHQLEIPVSVNVLNVKPFNGAMLLVLYPQVVSRAVEVFFGGGNLHFKTAVRQFTPSEMRMIRKLVGAVLHDLEKAWHSIYPLEFEHVDSDVNPYYVGVISNNEAVVNARFEVDIEGKTSEMHICMPYSMLEPLRHYLVATVQNREGEQDEYFKHQMREALQEATVEVSGLLTQATLTLEALMMLKKGDLIPVDIPKKIPLVVEGVPVYQGEYGVVQKRWALRIEKPLLEET